MRHVCGPLGIPLERMRERRPRLSTRAAHASWWLASLPVRLLLVLGAL